MPRDIDPAWSFGEAIDNNRLKIKCKFCGKVIHGGITRFKQHLGHISGNVAGCTEVPREVREQMKALLSQNKARKVEIKEKRRQEVDAARYEVFGDEYFDEEEDAQMEAARRESIMSQQEEYERRAFAGSKFYDAGGSSSAVPSRGKGIGGAMRRAFSTRERDVDVEVISTRRAVPPPLDPLAHRKEGAKQPKISSVVKGVMKAARDRLAKATAGYFLNPEFYYQNAELHTEAIDTELRVGLREVLKRLLSADDQVDAVQEISMYTQRRGTFADPLVIRSIGRIPPADWWMYYGESAPHLRRAAVRILSQTTTSSNCERNWSTFSLIHTKARNRLTMHKLNKLVYCHYNLKLRNRTRERKARDDPAYCPINLDNIFRDDDPLLPWLAEIEDPLLDSDPGFQGTIQELIDEDIGEGQAPAEGQPPQGEGTSTRSSRTRSGKEPATIGSSEKASSTTVSSSSHGGGDSGTGGTSEYYQHDEDDVVPVEEVQELPSGRFDPSRGYQRRRRVSPPGVGGGNEQGNIGGDVGGQQAASWTDSWNPSYSGQGPSHYFPYGQVQGQEQSSTSGSYSYGDYGETQYGRYPPPPPISYDDPAAFFGFVDANAHQYQIQYGANRNENTDDDDDEDNHGALNLGRHSFWW